MWLGTQKGWKVSIGRMLYWLADEIDRLPSIHAIGHTLGFGGVAKAIRAASDSVYNWIGSALNATAYPVAVFFRYLAKVVEYPAIQLSGLAADVYTTLYRLRKIIVPAMIAAKVAWIPRHLIALEREVAAIAHRAPRLVIHEAAKLTKPIVKVAVHQAVAIPWPRLGRLEREAGTIGKRIDRLAHKVTPAALAAAVVLALSKVGGSWIRCARAKNVGKQVCGMDTDLLDSLIAGSFLIVGAMSLREFTEAMQESMGTITPQVTKFWRA
jgi:hypothetical protein